jgi:hypothetical protein
VLKSLAVAATVAGVLATASPASAATAQASDDLPSGNCPQGQLCLWPDFNPWGTASLTTSANWSGQVTGLYFYNRTSRSVDIVHSLNGAGPYTRCANPGGGDLYIHANVTKVTFRTGPCAW